MIKILIADDDPQIRVIMITAFATIESAVEAMKKGASDYVSKPVRREAFTGLADKLGSEVYQWA